MRLLRSFYLKKRMNITVRVLKSGSIKATAYFRSEKSAAEEALTDMQRKLLIGAGRVYIEAKQYVDAERVFKEVQKRYPDNAWGPFLLARVNQDQGKCAAALPLFEKTIALEADGYAYFLMAQCLELLNEKNRALAAFERALEFKNNLNKQHQKEAAARIKALKA